MATIEGHKSGSSSTRTPSESPDSLQSTSYAKILLALGEGEFAGGLDGTTIFLDGTPIQSVDGTVNFPGVQWEFRSGTPDQSYIAGMPDVENETAVGLELTGQTAWTRAVTNTQLSAVRLRFSWSSLQQQKDNGDVVGYRIEYAVDVATDGGAYQQVLSTAVDGKTITQYERSHRIDLARATTGWQIRVRRLTVNSTSNLTADKMVIEAITEVIDAKLRYPETALLFIQFDASQFQNIPAVACEPKGRVIRVPTTYDPVARTYSGTWDGTFKWAWSNNPAWVVYDILLAERFGLGERITADNLYYTKWDLYLVAQYCDQLVPDGRGGSAVEPRFLCDVYIQSQEEAWTVLNDLVAVFRGMMFWANNQMNVLADMPRDMDYAITRANVKDGKFTYSSASEKTHYSTAMVSYSDPDNGYQDAVQPVAENALVRRFGIKQADITAIGCIRQTESIRRGKWVLNTNDNDRGVAFTVGLDGKIPLPGYVIGIADEMLAGRPLGGRISAADGRNITLDRVSSAAAGERLIINLPSGKAEGRTIAAAVGKIVTVTTAYSETPEAECVWAVDATDLALQLFRVTGITQSDDGVSYDITAIEYDPNKFARIDTGARIEDRPITVIPPGVQAPPANVVISSYTAIAQGLAVTTLRVTWNKADGAIAYEAQWRKDNGNWITGPRTSAQGFEVTGIYAGQYQARVRAINAAEISSIWTNALETQLNGKEGNPPKPVGLAAQGLLFGIKLTWSFPDGAGDTLKTEIQYATAADGANALLLADVPYPQTVYQQMGLGAGVQFWYRAQLVDKSGNESGYTDWASGESSSDASDILDWIGKDIMTTEAGQRLTEKIDQTALTIENHSASIIENALADSSNAIQQWAHYGENRAGIIEVRQTTADTQQSFAQYQLLVTATFNGVESDISDIRLTQSDASAAFATFQQQVIADIANAKAAVDEVRTAQSGVDNAVSTIQQQASASIENTLANDKDAVQKWGRLGKISASVTQVSTAQANTAQALADYRQLVTAQFGTVTASIQTTATSLADLTGKVSAQWSVKLGVTSNGQYYAAGMAVGIENTPAGMQTQVLFLADRLALLNLSNGVVSTPFAIQNGQTFINSAFIQDASIGSAKIQDASINSAKISNTLQSNNFVSGQAGWLIDKGGGLYINGAEAGNGRMTIDNTGISVFDSTGALKIRIGRL